MLLSRYVFPEMIQRRQGRIINVCSGVGLVGIPNFSSYVISKTALIRFSENLAHLRTCADVWGDSIEAMLEEETPTLAHIHPRDWLKVTDYANLHFHDSLSAFTEQRHQLLNTLKTLNFADWSRGALIKGRVHTIFSQARRMAKHELIHCLQIEALIDIIRS